MGAGHCGSTLLDLILGSHSEGFSLAEFRMISSLLDESDGEIPENVCVICPGRCEFWNGRVPARDLRLLYSRKNLFRKIRRRIARRFRNPYDLLFAAAGKSLLVDSSKTPGWFRAQLEPLGVWKDVVPRLVYLKRDGRAVVNSYLRKYPERGLDDITAKWVHSVNEANAFYSRFPFETKTVVHYEELARHPEESVTRICDFLGLSFEKQMLLYWSHDHHPIAGNGGTQSLILRYREELGEMSEERRTKINEGDKYYETKYYDDVGLAIRFDERWKREMTEDQIAEFDRLAGGLNRDFTSSG